MDSFNINVEKRFIGSKSEIKKMKMDGYTPGVLYDGMKSIPIQLDTLTLREILKKHGKHALLNLNFNGRVVQVTIKDIKTHPVNYELQHIDLMPVDGTSNFPGVLH